MTDPRLVPLEFNRGPEHLARVLELVLAAARRTLASSGGDTEHGVHIEDFLLARIDDEGMTDHIQPGVARHFLVELGLLVQLPGGNWRFKPSLPVRETALTDLIAAGKVPYEQSSDDLSRPGDVFRPIEPGETEIERLRVRCARLEDDAARLRLMNAGLLRTLAEMNMTALDE